MWQRAKDLAVVIYKLSEQSRLGKDFVLSRQIRRSAVSIASNIAEGDERETNKEANRFFYIAKGSLAELRTQLQIASESGLLEKSTYEAVEPDCERLGFMIGKLIRSRSEASHR